MFGNIVLSKNFVQGHKIVFKARKHIIEHFVSKLDTRTRKYKNKLYKIYTIQVRAIIIFLCIDIYAL